MRLHLMSDIHLDHDDAADAKFLADLKPQPDIDALVLAGDWYSICRRRETPELFKRLLDLYDQVIVVPGNHDYWLVTPSEANEVMTSVVDPRLHVFPYPEIKTIKGQRFLGGTLWYRKPKGDQLQDFIDMRQVRVAKQWFFLQQRAFEEKMEEGGSIEDVIVVSHHLPNPNSTPEIFKGSPADHFFMCNMTSSIMRRKPKLWLHGHTHEGFDYTIGNTRVVCHPRGYPFEYKRREGFGLIYEPMLIEI